MNLSISQLQSYRDHLHDVISGLRSVLEFRECELEFVNSLITKHNENEKY